MNRLKLRLAHLRLHHIAVFEALFLLVITFMLAAHPVYAADVTRLQSRSMYINNPNPGAVTNYTIAFKYATPAEIGSVDILFCVSPIPDDPCSPPAGLDVSGASLESQTGEIGYTMLIPATNHIILTRTPGMTGTDLSTYKFAGIRNPASNLRSFSARLSTHLSTDASDPYPYVNLGSVLSQTVDSIYLETQVPPVLIFCLGKEVSADCETIDGDWYTDLGELSSTKTLYASSQMAASTNATNGYTITANGTTMQAGTHVIQALNTPKAAQPGIPQFGINLRANTTPEIGSDPDGVWATPDPTPGYDTPNLFKYVDGDAVVNSVDVSLRRRFTVSYIVNAPADLRAGVYTTTVTFICAGRF